ncbi:hypothetical protein ACSZOC_09170 [Aeromonas hydrophila]
MNYIRILFFGIMAFVCVFFGWNMLEQAFGEQREVYVIDGVLNYWAVLGGFLSSLVIIGYCVTEIVKKNQQYHF